jgi:hypothetical protein
VRRHFGTHQQKMGPRIIDGLKWCWFCSRACAMASRRYEFRSVGAAQTAHQRKAFDRLFQRLVTACREVMDAEQRVPIRAMVKVMMRELRMARSRGATEQWHRHRREAVRRWVA